MENTQTYENFISDQFDLEAKPENRSEFKSRPSYMDARNSLVRRSSILSNISLQIEDDVRFKYKKEYNAYQERKKSFWFRLGSRIRPVLAEIILWFNREETTKYLVMVWLVSLLILCWLSVEVCEHLESNQTMALLSLMCIIFLGYGGVGLFGGVLLVKRACMDDPRKRRFMIESCEAFASTKNYELADSLMRLSKNCMQPVRNKKELPAFYPHRFFTSKTMHFSPKWQDSKKLAAEIKRLDMIKISQ